MKEIIIEKADEIHSVLKRYRKSAHFKFRGQSDADWTLVPKAGRAEFTKVPDKEIFRHWKRRAISFLNNNNNNFTEWEYLAVAQHTGLPTRLLDWTHNPLIAAFFSANEHFDRPGALWVTGPVGFIAESDEKPFDLNEGMIHFYQPSTASPRVANQFGYFTIHNKPTLELNEDTCQLKADIEKIIIPKEIKQDLIFNLNQYGINYLTIYPDLEGLSRHLSWFCQQYEFWDGSMEE